MSRLSATQFFSSIQFTCLEHNIVHDATTNVHRIEYLNCSHTHKKKKKTEKKKNKCTEQ